MFSKFGYILYEREHGVYKVSSATLPNIRRVSEGRGLRWWESSICGRKKSAQKNASAGNRTRVDRVAGDHHTTRPLKRHLDGGAGHQRYIYTCSDSCFLTFLHPNLLRQSIAPIGHRRSQQATGSAMAMPVPAARHAAMRIAHRASRMAMGG